MLGTDRHDNLLMPTQGVWPEGPDRGSAPGLSLLSLPYDIRHLIYQHLFPPERQIYIQILQQSLTAIIPEDKVPTEILSTCKALHAEAGGFLYNNYLYNIIGTKKECLEGYESFLQTMEKHARDEVQVNAFSNGAHSSTMCISLGVGEARMTLLQRRRRGQPVRIQDLKREIAMKEAKSQPMPVWLSLFMVLGTMMAVLAALIMYGQP